MPGVEYIYLPRCLKYRKIGNSFERMRNFFSLEKHSFRESVGVRSEGVSLLAFTRENGEWCVHERARVCETVCSLCDRRGESATAATSA